MLATELRISVCGCGGCDGVCVSSSFINQEFHHSLIRDSAKFLDTKWLVLMKMLL
jgi:hypothetical protein